MSRDGAGGASIAAMNRWLAAALAALALAGCAARGNESEREWQRAECNRIIDEDALNRCMKRVDDDYGSRRVAETETRKL